MLYQPPDKSFMIEERIRRIAIVGPESTGKTTLAKDLAESLNTSWVPEYAREYIEQLNRSYHQQDLLHIARKQIEIEDALISQANTFLICDTNLVVLKIWSEYRYGNLDSWINQQLHKRIYDCYLLTACDVPWEFDPQRENPDDRQVLFDQYESFLANQKLPYFVLKGGRQERKERAIEIISDL